MSELINRDRRTFLANGVVGVAAAQLGASSLALANPAEAKLPLKQIDAGLLNVGYAKRVRPTVGRSFSCTDGPTTFTASSMSSPCWRRQATG